MKVLVADDHALFREGLRQVLKALDATVAVVEASTYPEAIRLAEESDDLDLIMTDMLMPGGEGMEGLKGLKAAARDVPIIVVSAHDDRVRVLKAINVGANGYISKTLNVRVVTGAINLVLAGGTYLPPTLLGGAEPGAAGKPRLTARQADVLQLIATGKSNKEIARALGLAEGTVKLHVGAIMRLLKLNNRTKLAVAAADLGLIAKP